MLWVVNVPRTAAESGTAEVDKVKEVFAEMLGLAADVDWATVAYQSTEGWDSLAHMAIVGELEDRFGIMLDADDVIEMSSFAKALEILAKYGVQPG